MAVFCGGAGTEAVSVSTSGEDVDLDEVAVEVFMARGSVGAFSTGFDSSSTTALVTGAAIGSGPGSTAFFLVCGSAPALYLLS